MLSTHELQSRFPRKPESEAYKIIQFYSRLSKFPTAVMQSHSAPEAANEQRAITITEPPFHFFVTDVTLDLAGAPNASACQKCHKM